MKKEGLILLAISILIISSVSFVNADELSDKIITEDIMMWKLIDSSMTTNGIGDITYMGTYEAQDPRAQAGFTRFFVHVIKPKQETAEEIFNNKKGILSGREGKVIKMVKLSNQLVDVAWFSGEYLIQIGSGSLEEIASNYIGGIEFLGDAYMEKYPSDAELKDACEQIGLRRNGEYCFDTGVYVEQKTEGQYCDNNFECKSNVCMGDECIGLNLIQKIINFFKKLFGGEDEEEPEPPIVTLDECEEITDSAYKELCYIDMAIDTKDSSICEGEKIIDPTRKDSCYLNVGQITKDVTLCKKIINPLRKNDCYTNVAMYTNDVTLCEKVTDSFIKENCYVLVQESIYP